MPETPKRPVGRQENITGKGKGVRRRGQGLGTGPTGTSGLGQAGGAGTGGGSGRGTGGGNRGQGGGNPLIMIIIAVIVLLGGGGGIGSLLGGGSSDEGTSTGSSSGTGSSGSYYGSYTGGTGSSSGGTYTPQFGGSTGSSSGSSSGSGWSTGSSGSSSGSGWSTGSSGSSSGSGWSTGSSGSGSGTGSSGFSGLFTSGSDDYDTYSGSGSGLDLSEFAGLFSSGFSDSAAGVSGGWADGKGNSGVLNTSVSPEARERYTSIRGGGKDTVTIMVYMCGTDLESRSGMATSDLSEMARASLSDNVNLLVYTGGCTRWKNNIVQADRNQIFRVRGGGLEKLVDNDGRKPMTDPDTLSSFIRWCAKNFPANRNMLIFWDHGGGSASGFGYDEKYKNSGSMDLAEINQAISDSGETFDFIGFDACLMATAETAISLSRYADYMIASEETEPGMGWYYTNWLGALSDNTSISTVMLGKQIIDDFVDVSAQKCRGQSTTLSLVDLAEFQETFPGAFSAFAKDTSKMMEQAEYAEVSGARSETREFAPSTKIDQVDLVNLAQNLGTEEGQALTEVLLGAVKYNRTSKDMTNSYGLSIFFPSRRLSYVDSMVKTYKALGVDEDYTRCIQQAATMQASGQAVSGGTSSPFGMLEQLLGGSGSYSTGSSGSSYGSLFGGSGSSYGSGYSTGSSGSSYGSLFGGSGSSYGSSYSTGSSGSSGSDMLDLISSLLGGEVSGLSGLDSGNTGFFSGSGLSGKQIVDSLEGNLFDPAALVWDTSTGQHLLHLPQSQWEMVSQLDLNLFYDDGEGLVNMGLDNPLHFTETGDLIGESSGAWISINDQPVAYFHVGTTVDNDGSTTIIGRVPCYLNGERANLILVFDDENPKGYVAGARTDYREGETDTLAKGMLPLQVGDVLDFVCDYYTYDGEYDDSYYLGEQMVVETAPVISSTWLDEGSLVITYRFTDLYGQDYWTEPFVQ